MPRTTETIRRTAAATVLTAAGLVFAATALLLVAGCRPPSLEYPPVTQAPPLVEPSEPATAHAEASETPTATATVPAPSSVATAGLRPVFSNPTFDSGLSTWVVYDYKPTTSPGTNIIELVPIAGRTGQSLHVARTSDNDSGGSGVTQRLTLDCTTFTTLRVSFSASISFGVGGNLAGARTGVAPDAPAMVRVKYVDTKGVDREYYHGLYTGAAAGADPVHFQQVSPGQWVSWVSPNLMDLPDKPKRVTEVTYLGFGSAFDSTLDDCQLWSGS
jgi:hypothetical protein